MVPQKWDIFWSFKGKGVGVVGWPKNGLCGNTQGWGYDVCPTWYLLISSLIWNHLLLSPARPPHVYVISEVVHVPCRWVVSSSRSVNNISNICHQHHRCKISLLSVLTHKKDFTHYMHIMWNFLLNKMWFFLYGGDLRNRAVLLQDNLVGNEFTKFLV